MSRTDLRSILLIAAAAFLLRAGVAVVTEFKPIFPAYYYTDAAFVDHYARDMTHAWSLGERHLLPYAPSQRLQILLTALIYRAVGPHPIAAKLLNALAAAFGIGAFGLLAGRIFEPRCGAASAAMAALWPSHAFYTSQNFKEGLICGALMGGFLLLTPGSDTAPERRKLHAAGGVAMLVLLGFLRSYVMIIACAALAAGAVLALLRRGGPRNAAWLALAACLAAPFMYQASMSVLLRGPLKASVAGPVSANDLIPKIADSTSGVVHSPLSPQGIAGFRRERLAADRVYAKGQSDREIATQLFPDEDMTSWVDVLRFVPKAAFHVLFMPLPGLYPMGGKPGRLLAAAENVVLLALCLLALASAARGSLASRRLGLLLFFVAMTAVSSLIEFDLGSSGRHKLMYLPMIFPFAAEEFLRLMGQWRRA